ncbi:MAG: hypothetical protein K6G00_11955 [Treponema sp.]|nr:hypothetical protein [Treponema sp.]
MKNCAAIKLVFIIFLTCLCINVHAQSRRQSGKKNNPPSHKHSSSQNSNSTSVPNCANEFLNFRGQRKPVESEDFYMQELTTGDYNLETLVITLTFNQIINPKSIRLENITVKNIIQYNVINISFNKEGTKVRLTVNDPIDFPISFYISNVQSYNGKTVPSILVDNINDNETFKYNKEEELWQKY